MAKVNPIQVQKFLGGVDYPARKNDLVEHAKKQGADENVVSTLEQIAEREYDGPNAVAQAIGKVQ